MPDRVKPSFCNFWHPDTLTLSPERQSARISKITNANNPVWHRMLYSCTHMATVGVRGLRVGERPFIPSPRHSTPVDAVVVVAPSAAPLRVESAAVNTSSIRVSWRPPAEHDRNGVITGYRVRYAAQWTGHQDHLNSDPPRDATTVMTSGSDRSSVIAGLATWTAYRIWVSAFTRAGEGPHSDMIVVQTDEGGTFPHRNRNRNLTIWHSLLPFMHNYRASYARPG